MYTHIHIIILEVRLYFFENKIWILKKIWLFPFFNYILYSYSYQNIYSMESS